MHCCKLSLYKISRKTNAQNLRKWQKTQFWDRFWSFRPKSGPQRFLDFNSTRCQTFLQAIIVYDISWKTKETNLKKWQKKPSFGPQRFLDFTSTRCQTFLQAIIVYDISQKTNETNLKKWQKKTSFGPILAQIQAAKIWLCQLLDTMVSNHHVQYQKKLMNLEKTQ